MARPCRRSTGRRRGRGRQRGPAGPPSHLRDPRRTASPSRPAPGLPRRARSPRSPDRQASLERRRRQAMSGVVPARIAAAFTLAELSVLTVIARQCQRTGVCVLHIDAIAALAGCCRTVVKNALRQARLLGLILVKERRIPGLPSLTNVVRIVSKDWIGWLKLGGRVGVRMATPTVIRRRFVDANREQAETLRRAIRACLENETPETRNPPCEAGRCPGKAGDYQVLAVRIIPEN